MQVLVVKSCSVPPSVTEMTFVRCRGESTSDDQDHKCARQQRCQAKMGEERSDLVKVSEATREDQQQHCAHKRHTLTQRGQKSSFNVRFSAYRQNADFADDEREGPRRGAGAAAKEHHRLSECIALSLSTFLSADGSTFQIELCSGPSANPLAPIFLAMSTFCYHLPIESAHVTNVGSSAT